MSCGLIQRTVASGTRTPIHQGGPRSPAAALASVSAAVERRHGVADALEPQAGDALLIVHLQNDFLPGGALGVPGGEAVIAPLNRCIEAFKHRRLPIFATRDWHPPDHCSFREQGGPWPPHCIAGTRGAAFAESLALDVGVHVVSQATRAETEAYSGFEDTNLAGELAARGVRRIFVGGLATDYCVRATVLDALSAGFAVIVIADAVRPIDAHPGDGARALAEMRARGAEILPRQSVSA